VTDHLLHSYRSNAFADAMLRLEIAPEHDDTHTIFTASVVDAFSAVNFDEHGYPLGQVFEAPALWELCRFEGLDHDAVADLRAPAAPRIATLAWLQGNLAHATTMQRLSFALALVSVSRFALARRALDGIDPARTTVRQRFEIAMVRFIIANRAHDGDGSSACFAEMRRAIEEGKVPPDRVLGASAHAIVWHIKTGEIDAELFRWFVHAGQDAARAGVSAASRSSWYRAYAMVPAERRDAEQTRHVMERAREDAVRAVAEATHAYAKNLEKTYLESALKEYLHVRKDLDAAKQLAVQLLKLDPAWSPSYGEAAEVYTRAREHETAARLLERALELGPPYRLLHAYQLAGCRAKLGDDDGALALLGAILDLDPTNVSACLVGLKHARAIGHASAPRFSASLEAFTLRPEHHTFLEGSHAAF
jgi:hypothetical protein